MRVEAGVKGCRVSGSEEGEVVCVRAQHFIKKEMFESGLPW
jgi:hypothetical protein